ncbi:SDR family oxidoreductase [Thaumasiovibrio subtropicus]|uniref:SDR family oxidoreductase n=1 Tax=Thaumasiovibrio subtropicus TaxID=1891207 RepID=UPI000B34E7AF|nr:aldehyde reductase [Thaumasiovibrio subtropicus]
MESVNQHNPTATPATVVVTGITGFLGSHIAVQLLNQGYIVKGTLRGEKRKAQIINTLRESCGELVANLSLHQADLMDDQGWDSVMEKTDFVIHAASPFLAHVPKNENDLIAPAVDGTLRVLNAAKSQNVKRVVLTSSIAAVVHNSDSAPYNESHWTSEHASTITPYYKSKTRAEKAAWQFAEQHDLPLSVINPGVILGPVLGKDYGTSAELIVKLLKGDFPGMPRIGFPVCDVRDVAAMHIQAMTSPQAVGERFITASEFMWTGDIAEVLRNQYPSYRKNLPTRQLPNWLVKMVALFDPALKTVVKELGLELRVDSNKAKTILGYKPTPNHAAIIATADSLLQQKVV